MDTKLVDKIKQIILATSLSDWRCMEINPAHWKYYSSKSELCLTYYPDTHTWLPHISVFVGGKELKLSEAGVSNLSDFMQQWIFEQQNPISLDF